MSVVLETQRLVLRLMKESDYDLLYSLFRDKQVMEFYPRLETEQEISIWTQAWIMRTLERYSADGTAFWIAERKGDQAFVGQVGLVRQVVEGREELEIGYLLHSAFWKQGFATEAAIACREHAFDKLGRKRVVSLIRPENLRSIAVAKRVGMQPERNVLHGGFLHRVWALHRLPDMISKSHHS